MNTKHIYLILASALMLLGLPGCSNNVDSDLMPTVADRVLTVDGHDTAYTMNFSAAPSSNEINVESNTLWKVEVVCEGGWCSVDKVSGRGNESFSIILRDNMIAKRTCSVTVYMVDAQGEKLEGVAGSSLAITVSQDVSSVQLSPSSLAPFSPQPTGREKLTVIANMGWTLDVTYEGENPVEFVTITPESGDMQSVGNGSFSGNGEASFWVSVADNRTAADRKAFLNLRAEGDVGSYTIEISQNKSDYTFDVTPSENQVVAADGGSIDFGVLSISGWKVDCSADWVTFSVPSYTESSNSRVETVATFAPNSDGRERSTIIRFTPTESQYQGLSVSVTQRGYDMMFSLSSADGSEVVMEGGGSLSFDLDSRFDWVIDTPTWASANPNSGTASNTSRLINVSVDANTSNSNRTGFVIVTPQPTAFAGGITLNPANLGIEPLRFSVTQFGGREAAISVPWILDGYTQTSATIEFNYYSPFAAVTEAGLQWRREDATDWTTETSTVSDPTEGTVTIEINSLNPATKYVARGYVRDANGAIKYGSVSYPFTTAGLYPGSGDNPTPNK